MRRDIIYQKWLVPITILFLCISCVSFSVSGLAEEQVLPASALIALQHSAIQTGDFQINTPQVKEMKILDAKQKAALDQAIENYEASTETLVINRSEFFYYYEALMPLERQMYDIMYQIAKDPDNAENVGLLFTAHDPSTEEFFSSFVKAQFAMTFDHPELFWLYNSSETFFLFGSDNMMVNGRYNVYFYLNEPYWNYQSEMSAFNEATDRFLEDIDRKTSEYGIAKQIHDKLIEVVTYDQDISSGGTDDLINLGHSAYGALVADSDGRKNHAVCDGYSLAYIYLLQQCNIPAVFIGGYGGEDEDNVGGHAWNMVQLDGVWYETDVTWDDIGEADDIADPVEDALTYLVYEEAFADPVYSEVLQHKMFLLSTETISHYIPDEEERYFYSSVLNGNISLIFESVHLREEEAGFLPADDPYLLVIATAPRAMEDYPT